MNALPKQRLSYKEKIANNYEWCKSVIDSILTSHGSDFTLNANTEYYRMLSNYQLFNNVINQKDFERECEPFGFEVGMYQDEVKPFNKTYNKIQVLLGEELRRPFKYRAVLINEDGIKSKMKYRDDLLRKYIYDSISAAFSQEEIKSMNPMEINTYMKTKYLDSREIMINKLLTYYERMLDIADKKNDAFKHSLISGYEITHVGEKNGEPSLEIINPLGFFYHKSGETKYIEDGLYAGFRTYMTGSQILDIFGDYLSKEDIEKLDTGELGGTFYNKTSSEIKIGDYSGTQFEASYGVLETTSEWLVQHVEWRSQRRVAFLTVGVGTPEETITIIDESFDPPSNAVKIVEKEEYNKATTYYQWNQDGEVYRVSYSWIPEVWEGVRIGHEIYCMMGPKKHQFRNADNPHEVSLGYHGAVVSAMNAPPISIMDRMKPFQYLYFIIMHKLKRLIAQDRGRIYNLDTTMIDPKLGWEKTLYYATQMGINFYNPLQNTDQPGYGQRGVPSSTDWSTTDYIANYMQLLGALDAQISDVAGINRQREGQALPTEAVTNAQSNIAMSSTITEIYFQLHSKVWEKTLSNLANIIVECYKGRKVTKQFILDDMSIETLNISPESLNNSQFGIFLSNSSKDEYVFKSLESLSQALIQNDKAKFSDFIKMLRTDSTEQLENYIIESEAKTEQMLMQQQQAQIQSNQQLQQAQHAFEMEKLDKELNAKILIAKIGALDAGEDMNDNGIKDELDIKKLEQKILMDQHKVKMDEEKLALEKRKLSTKSQ